MWFDAEDRDKDQDEAHPFFPVETGHPLAAAMFVVCAIGLLVAIFTVRP